MVPHSPGVLRGIFVGAPWFTQQREPWSQPQGSRAKEKIKTGVLVHLWSSEGPLKKVSLLFLLYLLFILLLAYSTCVQSREKQVYYEPKELSEYVAQLTESWAASWAQGTGADGQKWLQFTVQFREQKIIKSM